MISVFDLLVLSQIPNIGPNRLRLLVSHFLETSNIFSASAREIVNIEGFNKKLASSVVHFLKGAQLSEAKKYAERQLSKLNKVEGRAISFWDNQYPIPLKKIYDPPPVLFMLGAMKEVDSYSIAVVGTRSPSPYGITLAERFAHDLARLGITVVSGLARGIDSIVHGVVVKNGGRTIAVIGSGIDVIYPPENKNLAQRITADGAVISEYDIGTKPDAGNFPRRNRIISGLSLGTLIIETDIGGGAMITANTALDQNREVFAVPGPVNVKQSSGCNYLIKNGRAKLVESIDDILEELSFKLRPILHDQPKVAQKPVPELSLFEKTVYDALGDQQMHIDAIAERTKASTSDTLVNLLSLEFKGLIKQLPGKMFMKL